jgi:hypothetical protein
MTSWTGFLFFRLFYILMFLWKEGYLKKNPSDFTKCLTLFKLDNCFIMPVDHQSVLPRELKRHLNSTKQSLEGVPRPSCVPSVRLRTGPTGSNWPRWLSCFTLFRDVTLKSVKPWTCLDSFRGKLISLSFITYNFPIPQAPLPCSWSG